MMKNLKSLKMGGLFIGLALIVSLFAAVPAKADYVRPAIEETTSAIWREAGLIDGFVPIAQYEFRNGSDTGPLWFVNDEWIGGREGREAFPWVSPWRSVGPPIGGTLDDYRNLLTFRINDFEANPFLSYAVSITFNSVSDLPDTLTINGNTIGGEGEFFYGLESILLFAQNEPINFSFGNDFRQHFVVTLYGSPNPNPIPEPATLAVLGLGLAGLGVARRRMKK